MPETVFGLPTHAIVVHATVVLLPLAALAVVLHAFWPEARRRLGVVTPVLAGVALLLVPLSTQSGESLEHSVGRTALVERHAHLADGLLPWAFGLFVVAVGLWLLDRRRAGSVARPDRARCRSWCPCSPSSPSSGPSSRWSASGTPVPRRPGTGSVQSPRRRGRHLSRPARRRRRRSPRTG